MKTGRHIAEVIGAIAATLIAAVVVVAVLFGPIAFLWAALVAVLVVVAYRQVVAPWHSTWGATRDEARAPLPGDELVPAAVATTRAITIDAPPAAVWPWLVQIGFDRAGWYSYDRIDNDGLPSASEVIDDLQGLSVGDRIPMTPELGFIVQVLTGPDVLVALSDDGSTSWVLHLEARPDGGTRLISRFRSPRPTGVPGLLWSAIGGPGAFIMERRMLIGIRSRAEARPAPVVP